MIDKMKKKSIKEKIENGIEQFNKYRSPEAKAKLISFNGKSLEVEFTGSFCRTCGFHDYFDDFKIFLEELELKTEIGKIKQIDEGAVVEFKL